jgi:hypothetical protein
MSTPKAKGDQARQLDLLHGVEGFSEAGASSGSLRRFCAYIQG